MAKALIMISNQQSYNDGKVAYPATFGAQDPPKLVATIGSGGNAKATWTWNNGQSYSKTGNINFIRGFCDAFIEKHPFGSVYDDTFYTMTENPILVSSIPKGVLIQTDFKPSPMVQNITSPVKQTIAATGTWGWFDNLKSWAMANPMLSIPIALVIAFVIWKKIKRGR